MLVTFCWVIFAAFVSTSKFPATGKSNSHWFSSQWSSGAELAWDKTRQQRVPFNSSTDHCAEKTDQVVALCRKCNRSRSDCKFHQGISVSPTWSHSERFSRKNLCWAKAAPRTALNLCAMKTGKSCLYSFSQKSSCVGRKMATEHILPNPRACSEIATNSKGGTERFMWRIASELPWEHSSDILNHTFSELNIWLLRCLWKGVKQHWSRPCFRLDKTRACPPCLSPPPPPSTVKSQVKMLPPQLWGNVTPPSDLSPQPSYLSRPSPHRCTPSDLSSLAVQRNGGSEVTWPFWPNPMFTFLPDGFSEEKEFCARVMVGACSQNVNVCRVISTSESKPGSGSFKFKWQIGSFELLHENKHLRKHIPFVTGSSIWVSACSQCAQQIVLLFQVPRDNDAEHIL